MGPPEAQGSAGQPQQPPQDPATEAERARRRELFLPAFACLVQSIQVRCSPPSVS